MRNALIRYRVMAYVVGVLLIVLTCVGMPLKYVWGQRQRRHRDRHRARLALHAAHHHRDRPRTPARWTWTRLC